jgi:predicted transcriptional regulator
MVPIMKVIKARCTPELKEKVKEFVKKSGESEEAMIRKAIRNYITTAPKSPLPGSH